MLAWKYATLALGASAREYTTRRFRTLHLHTLNAFHHSARSAQLELFDTARYRMPEVLSGHIIEGVRIVGIIKNDPAIREILLQSKIGSPVT